MTRNLTDLDPHELHALGLLPRRVDADDLVPFTCDLCLQKVWGIKVSEDGWKILDLEVFRGLKLLSLHPCAHEITPEILEDPDWGWIDA
jgi:hypothetical protein